MTWNVVIDEQGFILIIHKFMIIDDEVPEEVTLVDELLFMEKSWYLEMFTRKGMVDKQGSHNLRHPNFTPKNDEEI